MYPAANSTHRRHRFDAAGSPEKCLPQIRRAHAGRPGTGISESGILHRSEEAFLRQEVEAAGFRLVEEGKFLRNPNDPRDKNTPDPPQPKDEFVLKFVRP